MLSDGTDANMADFSEERRNGTCTIRTTGQHTVQEFTINTQGLPDTDDEYAQHVVKFLTAQLLECDIGYR